MKIEFINKKYKFLFDPNIRYKVLYGGRGSGKSWAAVQYLVIRAYTSKVRILCCREFQSSIRESVHHLIRQTIDRLGLGPYFRITRDSIVCTLTGSEFIFAGLHNNVQGIKSTEGIDICHVEEAANVSKSSWDSLLPTIRRPKSEFIIVFNPHERNDPTYRMFVDNEYGLAPLRAEHINYYDNPELDASTLQMAEARKEVDLDGYKHIWLGHPIEWSKQQILADKLVVSEFKLPREYDTYYGIDWGYSQDPTAMLRVHVIGNDLYIDKSAGGVGIEIDDIGTLIHETFPELNNGRIWADSAQPSIISHVRRKGRVHGLLGAEKWKGSVEDGIVILRGFNKIYVHPDCEDVIHEMNEYRWKVDNKTGEILNVPVDKNNHWIDALRYALSEVIEKLRSNTKDPWGFGD